MRLEGSTCLGAFALVVIVNLVPALNLEPTMKALAVALTLFSARPGTDVMHADSPPDAEAIPKRSQGTWYINEGVELSASNPAERLGLSITSGSLAARISKTRHYPATVQRLMVSIVVK